MDIQLENETRDSPKFRKRPLKVRNYFTSSNEMEILLRCKGLWKFVSLNTNSTTSSSSLPSEAKSQKRDLALSYILMSIDMLCKSSALTLQDPALVWKKLRDLYQAVSESAIDAKTISFSSVKNGSQRLNYKVCK